MEPARLEERSATFIGGPTASTPTSGWGEERTCVLVLIGATEDGTKELLAVVDGLPGKHPILA